MFYYSSVGVLALILHFIINREDLMIRFSREERKKPGNLVVFRYKLFLNVLTCFFIVDIAWGILYEYHHISALFPLVYSATVFYFLFMFHTMLTWVRFVVAYLDKRRFRGNALLYAVWIMFILGILYLMINRFWPVVFSFNEAHEYVPEKGRYIAYILQIATYGLTTVYMFVISIKTKGGEKLHYFAVGLTCLILGLFQILQIMYPMYPFYSMGLIITTSVVHSFVEAGEKKEKKIYDNIANSLAEDYEAMYYIDIETGEYREFSSSDRYKSMNVPFAGKDFYKETQLNAAKYAHPDDRDYAVSLYTKESLLKALEGRHSFSYKYRILVNGQPRFFLFTALHAGDGKHLVLYEKDIDDELAQESKRLKDQKKSITFSRIAESLASNYDLIYYVNIEKSDYISYEANNVYGKLDVRTSGEDFFAETAVNIPKIVHKNDRERVVEFLDRDNMISAMDNKKRHVIEYRLVINQKSQHFRMMVRKTSDGSHFIICVENIDAEVRREKQQMKALSTEKELARRDELTGIKNKTAYTEFEQAIQADIDNENDNTPFAIVVCDANNLKNINDTEGHVAGDEYIKASAQLLCDIFEHSPVFRVGGDEFAVFLLGNDYKNRQDLLNKLYAQVLDNQSTGNGPILAAGMSEYVPKTDSIVAEIFDRADKRMYENKRKLKNEI